MGIDAIALRRAWALAGDAWTWWIDELGSAFPRASAWLAGSGATASIALGRQVTGVVVRNRPGARQEVMADWPVALSDLNAEQASELGRLCRGCAVELTLCLHDVHHLTTWVPQSAGLSGEAVRYALMTDAPLLIEEIAFDWRRKETVQSTARPGWIEIDVVLCRRSTLDKAAEVLARCGVTPDRVVVAVPGHEATLRYTLQRYRRSGSDWLGANRRKLLIASAFGFLMLGPFGAGMYSQWQERAIRQELAQILSQRGQFEPLAQRQARVDAMADGALPAAMAVQASAVLDELARFTPTDAWLVELRLDRGQIRAIGRAANPGVVTRSIALSRAFQNVRLDAVNGVAVPDGGAVFELTATTRSIP